MKKDQQSQKLVEDKFVKAKLNGASNTSAAMIATGAKTKDVAKTQGHRLSTSVNVQSAIAKSAGKALADAGLSIDDFVQTIKEAREATKVVTSHTEPDYAVPDWTARLKATEMGLKLLQAYSATKPNEDKPAQPLTDEIKDRIAKGDMPTLERIVFNSGAK